MKQSFYNLNFSDLENFLSSRELNTSAASLLFNHHYKKKMTDTCSANISKKTLDTIENDIHFSLPIIDTISEASDKTVKFLFKLHDGNKVECVLIPFNNKYSVCLSSQVGCAMNCSFCFTGTQGLTRSLETYEIVGQFLEAYRWLTKNRGGVRRF